MENVQPNNQMRKQGLEDTSIKAHNWSQGILFTTSCLMAMTHAFVERRQIVTFEDLGVLLSMA